MDLDLTWTLELDFGLGLGLGLWQLWPALAPGSWCADLMTRLWWHLIRNMTSVIITSIMVSISAAAQVWQIFCSDSASVHLLLWLQSVRRVEYSVELEQRRYSLVTVVWCGQWFSVSQPSVTSTPLLGIFSNNILCWSHQVVEKSWEQFYQCISVACG